MTTKTTEQLEIETLSLEQFTEKAYLEYSMYVILDRALPYIGDGLKPVQRRIVYAMSELGLNATAKFKKSARTVGDVLGKFHPHGDSACYEAMVLMAQSFSYRYPLIQGQGNWGSPDDPKSFAAMRYTESRLSFYCETLLKELGEGTVDFIPNFDGTLTEPLLFPARLPNILLNGATGIAVGMATDIPPHNLREVADACMHLLKNPDAKLDKICKFIQGPDYPTKAEIITPRNAIRQIYETGTGSIKMRAVYHKENGDIVITALPHQVSGSKILEQIAGQMQAKKIPMVADLRDESDHEEPVRLVIVPRSNRVDKEVLMDHLFATTDLEKNFRVNMNLIGLDKKPKVKTLLEILNEWIVFRTTTVKRRLKYRLDKIFTRLHILEGLLIAYLNIDEVIEIIRNEDKPKVHLIERFGLTEKQAEAILELKLRHLAKLEEIKIKKELDELEKEKNKLEKILKSPKLLNNLIHNEIKSDAKKYGDERNSRIIERKEALALTHADIIPNEPVTVILSTKGWVRAAKGHDIDITKLNYKSGDSFRSAVKGKSNELAVFLDSTGRAYSLACHSLPSARGQGEPLSGRLNPPSAARFQYVIAGDADQIFLMASDNGYGFITKLSNMYTNNKNGKILITLSNNSKVMEPIKIENPDTDMVVSISNKGRMLIFPISRLPNIAKGKGNKIINIYTAKQEYLAKIAVLPEKSYMELYSGKMKLTLTPDKYKEYFGERGRRGAVLPKVFHTINNFKILRIEDL